MGNIYNEKDLMAKLNATEMALDAFETVEEDLEEAKKKKKKPYDSATVTTGNIGYNIGQFNKHMGTAFPGNDNSNPSTEEAKAAANAAEAATQDLGGGEAGSSSTAGGEASVSSGDAGAGGASEGGAGMGESLMEGAYIKEDKIFVPKLARDDDVPEEDCYVELPTNVHVLSREQVNEAIAKLSPAEEFMVGYVTPIYFYTELWKLFSVVKCTEFIGYTGMDYRQVRDETRDDYADDRDARLGTAQSQIDNPTLGKNGKVKRIDSQKPKSYDQINKTVVQKKYNDINYTSILYYPAPGKKPRVCYYIDLHNGKGYMKISRGQFERFVVNYVEDAIANGTLVGSNRWNIDKLKAKIRKTLDVDDATSGKDTLDAEKLWEPTAVNAAGNKVFKPKVRALYTNQVYYIKTPYDDIGTPLAPSLLEDVELDEAKRETRRYYIRPQGIFCANKADVIRGLISVGDENCSVYSLKGLEDNRDIHLLTNKDIIYYYDDGVLYDKNHVKVMDYDLYIKHEEERKKFPGDADKVPESTFSDEYDDRITDITGPGLEDQVKEELTEEDNPFEIEFDDYNAYGEKITEEAPYETHTCCICGDEFVGYGNNPEPVKSFDDGVCCDACNIKFVIPARLSKL